MLKLRRLGRAPKLRFSDLTEISYAKKKLYPG